ncbi:hypothetical protein RJ639_045272 [Escallonia herrerae]|uniref:FMN-dependent dehydrogenase domain-containing protein n=1 Tax=Escallonia herrerae TaxID=1293975 RepID=A0AA88W9V4_9ASTE|nr:hypothetical protein RJ639_045272 [Escallonia herrerae]
MVTGVRGSGSGSGVMAVEPVNVNDYQELAREALPKMYYDYYNGGAEDQHTLRENVEAFRRIRQELGTAIINTI